jgi:hypothetical protein
MRSAEVADRPVRDGNFTGRDIGGRDRLSDQYNVDDTRGTTG